MQRCEAGSEFPFDKGGDELRERAFEPFNLQKPRPSCFAERFLYCSFHKRSSPLIEKNPVANTTKPYPQSRRNVGAIGLWSDIESPINQIGGALV